MEIAEDIELLDCPICQGPSIMEDEEGWCCYVACLDCGCHTAEVEYRSEEEKKEAVRKAAHLWNIGKVLRSDPGE